MTEENNKVNPMLTYCAINATKEVVAIGDNVGDVCAGYDTAAAYIQKVLTIPEVKYAEWNNTLRIAAGDNVYYTLYKGKVTDIIPGKHNAIINRDGEAINTYPEDGDAVYETYGDAEKALEIRNQKLDEEIQNAKDLQMILTAIIDNLQNDIDKLEEEKMN